MSNKEVAIGEAGDLQIAISSSLGTCNLAIQDALKQSAEKVCKEAVSRLKDNSPEDTGQYKKGWKYKVSVMQADGSFDIRIYNAKRGSLTHLIEKGHPIIAHGENVGYQKARPHIGPVNDWVQTEGFNQIAKAVADAVAKLKT